jgi:hypothetical protein
MQGCGHPAGNNSMSVAMALQVQQGIMSLKAQRLKLDKNSATVWLTNNSKNNSKNNKKRELLSTAMPAPESYIHTCMPVFMPNPPAGGNR